MAACFLCVEILQRVVYGDVQWNRASESKGGFEMQPALLSRKTSSLVVARPDAASMTTCNARVTAAV